MIATILSLNGGLLTTILCIHNQYLVTINSQIKLSVCLYGLLPLNMLMNFLVVM